MPAPVDSAHWFNWPLLHTSPRYRYDALKEFRADHDFVKPIEIQPLCELLRSTLG